jgi:hypothetical protein
MNQTPRLVISWGLVAVLLGYGIVQTLITAAKLFTQ